jgi:hypothetical protein
MIQNIYGFGSFQINSEATGGIPNAIQPGAAAAAVAEPQDRVTLSKEAQQAKHDDGAGLPKDEQNLSNEQKQQVNDLKRRDAEVKAHEQAHMAAGGGVVQGGASYEYQRGPDGKMYAVGGEVQIDVSPENSPEATVAKMQQVQRAAMAPAQPSGTDRAVAARAAQVEARARAEKSQANAPSAESADPTQASPSSIDADEDAPDESEKSDLSSSLGPQWSKGRPPLKSTGRRIDLRA